VVALFVVTALTTRLSGPDEPAAAEPTPTSTRITAWPAELDEATVGVKVDAWPEAQAPLDIQVQPGQTVRLDAWTPSRRPAGSRPAAAAGASPAG
jgi:hypothetical protein